MVIGQDENKPAANATFADAMPCHGLDFDGMHSDSEVHVSTVECPANLAAAPARARLAKT